MVAVIALSRSGRSSVSTTTPSRGRSSRNVVGPSAGGCSSDIGSVVLSVTGSAAHRGEDVLRRGLQFLRLEAPRRAAQVGVVEGRGGLGRAGGQVRGVAGDAGGGAR